VRASVASCREQYSNREQRTKTEEGLWSLILLHEPLRFDGRPIVGHGYRIDSLDLLIMRVLDGVYGHHRRRTPFPLSQLRTSASLLPQAPARSSMLASDFSCLACLSTVQRLQELQILHQTRGSTCLDLSRPASTVPTAANWPPQYAVPVCHMCRFSRGGPNTSTLSGFCRLLAVLMRSCLLPLRRRKTCLENSIHKYVAAYSRSCNLICVTSNASRGKKTWRSRALPCSFCKSQNSMSRLQSNNHNGAQERGRLAPGALAGRSTGPSRAHGLIIAAQSSLM
jgi:hypothetical protein